MQCSVPRKIFIRHRDSAKVYLIRAMHIGGAQELRYIETQGPVLDGGVANPTVSPQDDNVQSCLGRLWHGNLAIDLPLIIYRSLGFLRAPSG